MRKLFIPLLLAVLAAGSVGAADLSAVLGGEVALRMTARSFSQELAANDPRVARTRTLLDQAVQLTHEEPITIEAACSRYVGHLFDSAHIAATPLELLEALAGFGQVGQPMNETLQAYASARRAAPAKSHTEAMAALRQQK